MRRFRAAFDRLLTRFPAANIICVTHGIEYILSLSHTYLNPERCVLALATLHIARCWHARDMLRKPPKPLTVNHEDPKPLTIDVACS